MLYTLQQFKNSEITLTFSNDNHLIFTVCYQDNCFQITYFNKLLIETYEDIESTLSAIDKTIKKFEQHR